MFSFHCLFPMANQSFTNEASCFVKQIVNDITAGLHEKIETIIAARLLTVDKKITMQCIQVNMILDTCEKLTDAVNSMKKDINVLNEKVKNMESKSEDIKKIQPEIKTNTNKISVLTKDLNKLKDNIKALKKNNKHPESISQEKIKTLIDESVNEKIQQVVSKSDLEPITAEISTIGTKIKDMDESIEINNNELIIIKENELSTTKDLKWLFLRMDYLERTRASNDMFTMAQDRYYELDIRTTNMSLSISHLITSLNEHMATHSQLGLDNQ